MAAWWISAMVLLFCRILALEVMQVQAKEKKSLPPKIHHAGQAELTTPVAQRISPCRLT